MNEITPLSVCLEMVGAKPADREKRFGTAWRVSFGILRDKLSDGDKAALTEYILETWSNGQP